MEEKRKIRLSRFITGVVKNRKAVLEYFLRHVIGEKPARIIAKPLYYITCFAAVTIPVITLFNYCPLSSATPNSTSTTSTVITANPKKTETEEKPVEKNYIEIDPKDFAEVFGVPVDEIDIKNAGNLRAIAQGYHRREDLRERTPDIMPTDGRRSHDYAWRKNVYGGIGPNRYGFHTGEDIVAPLGTSVIAAAKGIITKVGYEPWPRGFHLEISHGKNAEGVHIKTIYYHLSDISEKIKRLGIEVEKSEEIGKVGAEGFATGPHLHYEVWENDSHVNPDKYLPKK